MTPARSPATAARTRCSTAAPWHGSYPAVRRATWCSEASSPAAEATVRPPRCCAPACRCLRPPGTIRRSPLSASCPTTAPGGSGPCRPVESSGGDGQAAMEGAREQLRLPPGRPAGDRRLAVRDQVQLDVAVVERHARTPHEL